MSAAASMLRRFGSWPPRDDPRGLCLHRGGAKGGVDGGLTNHRHRHVAENADPERYSRLSHPGDARRYVQPGRPAGAGVARRGAGSSDAAIRCGYRRVTVGDVLDDLRQLRGSAREGLRRLPGAFAVRRCRTAGRHQRTRGFRAGEVRPVAVPRRSARPDDERHHRNRCGRRRPAGLLHGEADNDLLRTWEIAGTAHADAYTVKVGFIDTGSTPTEQLAAGYAPSNELMGQALTLHQLRAAAPLCAAGGARRPACVGPGRHRAAARPAAGDRRRCAARVRRRRERHREGRCAHALGRRADRAHRIGDDTTPVARSSGLVSRSATPPAAGSIRAGRASTSNASRSRSTRRSAPGYLQRADRAEILELAAVTY